MNEFEFEESPWETFLGSHKNGASVSAWNLLSMLEEEDDEAVEEAFGLIREKQLLLDISSLPKTEYAGQAALRLKQEKEYVQKGLSPEAMEENDPLRLYLEEIAGMPSYGEETLLAQALLSGSRNAAEQLTMLGLSRVVEMAAPFAGWNVLLLDLIQEGSIGLWEAIGTYTGGDYFSHRDRMIHNSLCKAIILQARNNGLAQKMRQALQNYRSADTQLLTQLGRNPSLEEIADRMNITREEAEILKKMMDDASALEQAEKLTQPKEETTEDEQAVEDTAYFQMRQRIGELLSSLSELDARILTLRFGLENSRPLSAEEAAKSLGMTSGEVSQREAAALAKLRTEK